MIEELLRLVAGLARRLERLEVQEGIPIWTDWTPTVTQSVSVTVTVTEAKYAIVGKVCHIYARLAVTGSGTAGQEISIGGIPSAAQPAVSSQYFAIGAFVADDTGSTRFAGSLVANSSTTFMMQSDANAARVGTTPSFGLANGDIIEFSASYRVS